MANERPEFDLEKLVAAVEKNGVEATLDKMAKDLAILTLKVSRQRPQAAREKKS